MKCSYYTVRQTALHTKLLFGLKFHGYVATEFMSNPTEKQIIVQQNLLDGGQPNYHLLGDEFPKSVSDHFVLGKILIWDDLIIITKMKCHTCFCTSG
jgi:hypothetical protein